jgi:hypothetical protein
VKKWKPKELKGGISFKKGFAPLLKRYATEHYFMIVDNINKN